MGKLADAGASVLAAGNKANTFGAGLASSVKKGAKESMTSNLAYGGAAAGVGAAFYNEYYDDTNRNNVKAAGHGAIYGGLGYAAGAGLHAGRSLTTGIWTGAKALFSSAEKAA